MSKIAKWLSAVLAGLLLLAALVYGYIWWEISPDIPTPESDVPIIHKVGFWGYQDHVELTSLEARVIYGDLNLFNNKSVIEYNLQGEIKFREGGRPYIEKVQISENFSSVGGKLPTSIEIHLMPVVAIEDDETYDGSPLKFDIKVQDYLQSGNWGKNRIRVYSMGLSSQVEVWQRK